jgi:hypothetical protein
MKTTAPGGTAPTVALKRLDVIGELIGALGVVTPAGQRHVMNRILDLLREETLRAVPSLTVGEVEAVMTALPKLEYEAGRIALSTGAFNGQAHAVIGVLRRTS